MFCSLLIAGNVANPYVGEIPGWRFLFAGAGLVAFCVAAGVAGFLVEPPHELDAAADKKGCAAVLSELKTVFNFLCIPTFCVMIMQGVFGTIPWSVMGNNLLYFKLCGLEDWEASILASEGTVMGMFGNIIGGMVADALARRFGYHGRPLSAQITVAIGIPLVFLQFYGIPAGSGSFGTYFALIAGFGVLGSWAQSGTNFPILSDIVPASDRSKVMAWECAGPGITSESEAACPPSRLFPVSGPLLRCHGKLIGKCHWPRHGVHLGHRCAQAENLEKAWIEREGEREGERERETFCTVIKSKRSRPRLDSGGRALAWDARAC